MRLINDYDADIRAITRIAACSHSTLTLMGYKFDQAPHPSTEHEGGVGSIHVQTMLYPGATASPSDEIIRV